MGMAWLQRGVQAFNNSSGMAKAMDNPEDIFTIPLFCVVAQWIHMDTGQSANFTTCTIRPRPRAIRFCNLGSRPSSEHGNDISVI